MRDDTTQGQKPHDDAPADDQPTLYRTGNKSGREITVHTDPDCQYLSRARNVYRVSRDERARRELRRCDYCEGDRSQSHDQPSVTCPRCGGSVGNVALHLPDCDPGGESA